MTSEEVSVETGGFREWPIWVGAFILAVAGIVVCLTIMAGYSPQSAIMDSQWFCGDYGVGNYGCKGVFASRYGKILGVPLPVYGLMYFMTIAIWLIAFAKRSFNLLLMAILTVGLAVSVSLLAILFLVLPGQCRWCLLVHACNLLLIVVGYAGGLRFARSALREPVRAYLGRAISVGLVVLCILGWGGVAVAQSRTNQIKREYVKLRHNREFQLWLYRAQKPKKITISDQDHLVGKRDAPVTIVIYTDFQCEHCHRAWKILQDLYRRENASGDNVALVIRHWPQSKRCNKYIEADWHPYACLAALASEASGAVGGPKAFWKYHELLEKNYHELDRSPYLEFARQIGLDTEKFTAAWNSSAVRTKLEADIESAKRLKISAVPSVFINGRYIDGWESPGLIEQIIREELGKAGKQQKRQNKIHD